MSAEKDLLIKLGEISASLEFIKEKLNRVEEKVNDFDHCVSDIDFQLGAHLKKHNEEKTWRQKVIYALIGAIGGVVAAVVGAIL